MGNIAHGNRFHRLNWPLQFIQIVVTHAILDRAFFPIQSVYYGVFFMTSYEVTCFSVLQTVYAHRADKPFFSNKYKAELGRKFVRKQW